MGGFRSPPPACLGLRDSDCRAARDRGKSFRSRLAASFNYSVHSVLMILLHQTHLIPFCVLGIDPRALISTLLCVGFSFLYHKGRFRNLTVFNHFLLLRWFQEKEDLKKKLEQYQEDIKVKTLHWFDILLLFNSTDSIQFCVYVL